METSSSSSSSDDSCDSFGSDGGFANTVNIKSYYSYQIAIRVPTPSATENCVCVVEEQLETEQEDGRETKDAQDHIRRGGVKWV